MGYFNIRRSFFIVPSEKCNAEFEKMDKFMCFLENSGVGKIIENVKDKDNKCKGHNGYNPYNLFATILFCFSKFNASLRDIEDKCIFDARVSYIMEGQIPNYTVIGDFINKYVVPNQYEIFTCITKQIIKEFQLEIVDVFLDGTKIEANANKYKFVWKPVKFHDRLDEKIKKLLLEIGHDNFSTKILVNSKAFSNDLQDYAKNNNIDVNHISNGKGKRSTKEQKISNWDVHI